MLTIFHWLSMVLFLLFDVAQSPLSFIVLSCLLGQRWWGICTLLFGYQSWSWMVKRFFMTFCWFLDGQSWWVHDIQECKGSTSWIIISAEQSKERVHLRSPFLFCKHEDAAANKFKWRKICFFGLAPMTWLKNCYSWDILSASAMKPEWQTKGNNW